MNRTTMFVGVFVLAAAATAESQTREMIMAKAKVGAARGIERGWVCGWWRGGAKECQ